MVDTSISWTHRPGTRGRSWNPTQGCALKSEGCRNCYAMRMARRFAGPGGWAEGLVNVKTGKWTGKTRLAIHKLTEPLSWREPSTVFVNSMSDLFYEGFSDEEIAAVFGVMAACPQHTFIILTKRPGRMRMWFRWVDSRPTPPGHGGGMTHPVGVCADAAAARGAPVSAARLYGLRGGGTAPWPLPNVWLGTSIENQDEIDRMVELAATPAVIRLLSCEPLLGHLELGLLGTLPNSITGSAYVMTYERIHWVIAGCESGQGSRPCNVEWLRSLRDQCAEAAVKFFLKQAEESADLGEERLLDIGDDESLSFGDGSRLKKRRTKGNHIVELPYLDGVQHAEFPEVA